MNTKFIDELWVFVAVDPRDGEEGIVGEKPDGDENWYPFVATNEALYQEMRTKAMHISAKSPHLEIKILKFTDRKVLEVIDRTTLGTTQYN